MRIFPKALPASFPRAARPPAASRPTSPSVSAASPAESPSAPAEVGSPSDGSSGGSSSNADLGSDSPSLPVVPTSSPVVSGFASAWPGSKYWGSCIPTSKRGLPPLISFKGLRSLGGP